MKPKLIIYIFVAILPSIIYGTKTLLDYSCDVERIARTDVGAINGIFRPLPNGFLGNGTYGFIYRGIMLPINKTIAMKFTKLEKQRKAQKEYEMYTYLNAINRTDVERYGIPAVYYYGKWNESDLIMMGFSLLDIDLVYLVNSKQFLAHDVNVLIVLRDFILTSKYIHSRGVRHDDIKLSNMMIRKHRTFLIDFNLSHHMRTKSRAGTPDYLSRRGHSNGQRYPKDDWESFLYSMCHTLGVKLDWFNEKKRDINDLKDNTDETIRMIGTIKADILRNIFGQLAKHIFDDGGEFESDGECFEDNRTFYHSFADDRFPMYDAFYELVNDEIEKLNLPKPIMFTWLKDKARVEAIEDLCNNPTPDITKIDTFTSFDYLEMDYPDVDLQLFTRTYKDWKGPKVSTIFPDSSSAESSIVSRAGSGSSTGKRKQHAAHTRGKEKGSKSSDGKSTKYPRKENSQQQN